MANHWSGSVARPKGSIIDAREGLRLARRYISRLDRVVSDVVAPRVIGIRERNPGKRGAKKIRESYHRVFMKYLPTLYTFDSARQMFIAASTVDCENDSDGTNIAFETLDVVTGNTELVMMVTQHALGRRIQRAGYDPEAIDADLMDALRGVVDCWPKIRGSLPEWSELLGAIERVGEGVGVLRSVGGIDFKIPVSRGTWRCDVRGLYRPQTLSAGFCPTVSTFVPRKPSDKAGEILFSSSDEVAQFRDG